MKLQDVDFRPMADAQRVKMLYYSNGQITAVVCEDMTGDVVTIISLNPEALLRIMETKKLYHLVSGQVVEFSWEAVVPGGEACGDGLHLSAYDQPQTKTYTFEVKKVNANPDGNLVQIVVNGTNRYKNKTGLTIWEQFYGDTFYH